MVKGQGRELSFEKMRDYIVDPRADILATEGPGRTHEDLVTNVDPALGVVLRLLARNFRHE
jgi:hypothetical protein